VLVGIIQVVAGVVLVGGLLMETVWVETVAQES